MRGAVLCCNSDADADAIILVVAQKRLGEIFTLYALQ